MTIKTYLFDFDDTIINTKIYAEMYEPVLKMIKKKLNFKDINAKAEELGLTKNKFGRWDTGDLCRELGVLEMYYQILEKHIKVVPVLHDTIITVFKKIKKQNKTIGIISNSMIRTITAYLNKYKLHEYLDFVFSSDDTESKKKEEIYWQKLIKKHKLKPKECLVIGDDPIQDEEVPNKFGFNTFIINDAKDLGKVI